MRRAVHGLFGPIFAVIVIAALLGALPAAPAHAGGNGLEGGKACPPAGNPTCGDPVTISTGNVFQEVIDYETAGPNKLTLKRYYNSPIQGTFNFFASFINWRSNYDSFIYFVPGPCCVVDVILPDNKNFYFQFTNNGWKGPANLSVRFTNVGASYRLTDWNDTVWTYEIPQSFAGSVVSRLTSIKARNGYTQTLSYSGITSGACLGSCSLVSVTDSYGRTLTFTPVYDGGPAASVTTPDGQVLTYSYGDNQLNSATYPTNPPTTQTYLYTDPNFPGGLSAIVDEDGNRFAAWTYDTSGRATKSKHHADVTKIVYNDVDGSRTVTNALGQKTVYKFTQFDAGLSGVVAICTEMDRLATATTAAAIRLFTYDTNGYLASETDWNGVKTSYVNDSLGRPTSITEAVGTAQERTTTVTYHPTYHLASQIVSPGLTTDLTYDGAGNPLTKTLTDTTTTTIPYATGGTTRTWTYTWSNFLPASIKGPRTDVTALTTFGYDSTGALTSVTNAAGQIITVTQHMPGGLPLTVVDPNNITTSLTYDERLRLLTRSILTGTGPVTTTYAYDAVGNVVGVTFPDGAGFAYTYDAANRLTGIADLFGQQIVYTLDALGNPTETDVLDALGNPRRQQSAVFDALGRVLQDIGGVGQTTVHAYDNVGNRLSTIDPLDQPTLRGFDALDRLSTITDPAHGVTVIGYDMQDRPTSVTDANGATTTYVYDGFGDVIQRVSPDTGTTVYHYDQAGNLVQKIEATGVVTNYSYDALDRMITTTYPGNATEDVAYSYDQAGHGFGIGRLTTVNDAAGTVAYTYDERGNHLSESRVIDTTTLTTSYAYDAASRVASITYPSGTTVSYDRDAMGQVTAVTAQPPGAPTPLSVVYAVKYQPFGPIRKLTYGNGVVETRKFDLDYRLTKLVGTGADALQHLNYGYDLGDRTVAVTDLVNPDQSQLFAYDVLDRLTTASGSYGNLAYTYDAVGNRLTQTLGPTTTTYAYLAGSNRLLKINTNGTIEKFKYTAAGNMKDIIPSAGSGTTLVYNQANRLASVAVVQPVAAYTYDASGQRLIKTVPNSSPVLYQYDRSGHLLEETDGQSIATDYVYLGSRPIAAVSSGSGALAFLHTDRLGTPQLATDSQQSVVWTASYQPFGDATATTGSITQNLRLPGQYFDAETGWHHNGFRDYAPSLGRYLQSDPIGLAGGDVDLYAYVFNDPLNRRDPSGLDLKHDLGDFIRDWFKDKAIDKARDIAKDQPALTPEEQIQQILRDYGRESRDLKRNYTPGPARKKLEKKLLEKYVCKLATARAGADAGKLGDLLNALGKLTPKEVTETVVTEEAKEAGKDAKSGVDWAQKKYDEAVGKLFGAPQP